MPWTRRVILDNENISWINIFNIHCIPVGSKGYIEEKPKAVDPEAAQVSLSSSSSLAFTQLSLRARTHLLSDGGADAATLYSTTSS